MKFLVFLENDVSLDTGDGINERESLLALLEHYGDQLVVVLPEATYPENFYDSRITYVPNHNVYKPLSYLRFLLASWWAIRKAVKQEEIAAIIHRPGATLLLPSLLCRSDTPIILKTLAAFNHMKKNDSSFLKRMTIQAHRFLAPSFFSRCIGADVVSELYVDYFSDQYGMQRDSLKMIFNGANTRTFRPLDKEEARNFLGVTQFRKVAGYIGAIHSMRGLDVAIKSLSHLSDFSDLGLVFVGDGPEQENLLGLAKRLGVEDRVVFRKSMSYEDMPRVINAFDVGMDLTRVEVPSSQGIKIGSFSQKISQYLACGVPTIAWDAVDTQFIKKHRLGSVLTEESPLSVANALREVLSSDQIANRKSIHEYCNIHLSADSVAHKRWELWHRLLGISSNSQLEKKTEDVSARKSVA